jgi:hypothetical protein
MTDKDRTTLVQRLRGRAYEFYDNGEGGVDELCVEAIDEIERLRRELAEAQRDAERWQKASSAALLIYDAKARKIVQDFIAIWGQWGSKEGER